MKVVVYHVEHLTALLKSMSVLIKMCFITIISVCVKKPYLAPRSTWLYSA